MRKSILVASLLASTCAVSAPAWAQEPVSESAASGDEIIVTARRREESLQDVPAAITAFNAEQLLQRGIKTDSDLQLATPGLTIRQTQGNNSLTYSIRGQTADTFSGSPSAVIAYLNEVPLTISGASSFYDLESVQVLKGPQGTLFGRNATGGAVLYNTAKPVNETEGLLRGRIGNLGQREVEGMLNVPLVDDRVMLRGAFNIVRRDGYILNLLNGEKLGRTERDSGRVTLTLKPSDRLTNRTMFQYTATDGTNTGASYTYSVYACGQQNNGFNLTCGAGLLFGPGIDAAFGAPGLWAAYLAAHPQAYAPGLIDYVNEQRRIGPYQTRHPGGASHRGRDWFLTNTTEFELGDNLRLRNIIGFSRSKTDSEQPQLGAPFVTILTANAAIGRSGNELDVKSFSEELQLQGNALDKRLEYILGFYLQRQRSDTLWPQTYFDVSPILGPSYATNNFRIRNNTEAVYAQATYSFSDQFRATAGVRYTWEHVSIQQLPLADAFGAADQRKDFGDPSWEVGLEFQPNPDLLTYIKTRGSFRSGGFNGSAAPVSASAAAGGNLFDSEHTQDIEAGLKFGGNVFGRPAVFNTAAFIQWIQDVQRVEFPDPDGPGPLASIAVTANVPSSRIWGFEAEARLQPTDWLEIGGSLAYTNATFTNGNILLFGTPFSYGPVGDTPEWSGTAFAQVTFPTDERTGQISLRGDLYAQTAQYFSNAANSIAPGTKLPGYALVHGRLDWRNIMGTGFSAAVYGKNLTDKAYFTGGMTLAAALGHNAAAVGEPRTYGLELSFRF
jgi:iron complex outermembrane receptor protein